MTTTSSPKSLRWKRTISESFWMLWPTHGSICGASWSGLLMKHFPAPGFCTPAGTQRKPANSEAPQTQAYSTSSPLARQHWRRAAVYSRIKGRKHQWRVDPGWHPTVCTMALLEVQLAERSTRWSHLCLQLYHIHPTTHFLPPILLGDVGGQLEQS